MGKIKDDLIASHFLAYPHHKELLKAFLSGFNINAAAKREAANTTLFAFILEPETYIKEAFGIDQEILLVYSSFGTMEPRTIQAARYLLSQHPYGGRVDRINYMIISDCEQIEEWLSKYSLGDDGIQIAIPFSSNELLANQNDSWFIRNKLRANFFSVDLFGYTLPLRDDVYFFGRRQSIASHIDSIKRCENRGIFGLRKTGKTSLLFKIERQIREQHIGLTFFYDCKSPSFRMLHWNEMLGEICTNIAKRLNIWIRNSYDQANIIKSFRLVMKEASIRKKKIVLIFDEIEYISFKSPLNPHWKTEFIDFWQTIWSVQSIHRNLVFIVAGVNPSVAEIDNINGVQNPLFGIIQSEYLLGLEEGDACTMVRTLGKRMGLNFDYEATHYIFKQYGGHPMLTRLACSTLNKKLIDIDRPIEVTEMKIKNFQSSIDSELVYYFQHVVSEIRQFYPEEYELFELLASGHEVDFLEFARENEYVTHLYSYGLVSNAQNGKPTISMPVAGKYAAMQLAKKEGRTSTFRIVHSEQRNEWIKQRIDAIIRDFRILEKVISHRKSPSLFGINSFPEAEKFSALEPAESALGFLAFTNICYRCFVESIDNYGKEIGKPKYFWNEIKAAYPAIFDALHNIRVFRHSEGHSFLNDTVAERYGSLWDSYTQGYSKVEDKYFVVQQRLLDSLFLGIQLETLNLE